MNLNCFQLFAINLVILITNSEFFEKQKDFDFDEYNVSVFFISQSIATNLLICFQICKHEPKCAYLTFKSNKCSLYTKYASYIKKYDQNSVFYTRLSAFDLKGLVYYWPIFNSSTNDIVSRADLYEPVNAFIISNRFGIPKSAISLSVGRYKLPPRNYFDGDFTLMAWIRLTITSYFQRFIDCGISKNNTVIVILSNGLSNRPQICKNTNSYSELYFISRTPLEIGVWNHLTFTFKNGLGSYYKNGVLDQQGTLEYPVNILRTNCFLGKSLLIQDPDASADFDDIKLFNRALDDDEIRQEYHENF
ncbi:unnamed protein product [Brachionus calyciflorus]|uniref:Uncharacterized protein n=1 Tax=Brachionus calyciflorus TaxID=104777 RepID=A0A813QEX4_9BILA|nr:unnamed protein product [Brachionus calyciflorus]